MKGFQDKSLLAAVLMAGLSAASYSSAAPLRATADKRTNSVRIGSGGIAGSDSRRAGYGWTNRHQQRIAKKARNVKRHRAACR